MSSPPNSGRSSPVKTVSIGRGNNRVAKPAQLSPGQLKHRLISNKHMDAIKTSRKASNPLELSPSRRKLAVPRMRPAEDDDWQDIEAPEKGRSSAVSTTASTAADPALPQPHSEPSKSNLASRQANKNIELGWPELKPSPAIEHSIFTESTSNHSEKPESSSGDSSKKALTEAVLHTPKRDSEKRRKPVYVESESEDTTGSTNHSTSFLGFSPSQMGSRFIKSLSEQSRRFRPGYKHERYNEDPVTPERHSPRRFYIDAGIDPSINMQAPPRSFGYASSQQQPQSQQGQYEKPHSATYEHLKAFWLNPGTPALIALYLQVGFNVIMLGTLLYALYIFYLTICNDVDLKVEEYATDIVEQIAKCTHEYVRNGCEPSKRVPAMEAACQQWDRCMQRNPQEIGRAKVSAETFGMIIDAFFQPIGVKSMIFLVAGFAGSFILVNGVFSSRLGPRFSSYAGDFPHHMPQSSAAGPPPPPPPQPAQPTLYQQVQQPLNQSYIYASPIPSPSHIATPRGRHSPIHARLQSSPIRRPYMDFYE